MATSLIKEEDLYGWFMLGKPMLGVNNLELIKDIFVKDFNHFVDRNTVLPILFSFFIS
jgi:hypothetical protein